MTFDELKTTHPGVWEWRCLLEREQPLIRRHRRYLDRLFHSIAFYLLLRTTPQKDAMLHCLAGAASATAAFMMPPARGVPEEVLEQMKAVQRHLNPAVAGEWTMRGYIPVLRDALRTALFLGAIYSALLWLSRSAPSAFFRREAFWIMKLFKVRKEA